MRRWALRIFVFLLLLGGGAILNVAVAWGSVVRLRYYDVRMTQGWGPDEFAGMWARLAPPDWPAQPKREQCGQAFGLRSYSADAGEWHIQGGTTAKYLMLERCAGWPLLDLREVCRLDHANPGWVRDGSLRINVAIGRQPYFSLPLHPIWPGFAINTVLYASVLWLLFAAPFVLRRRRRMRRGLCLKCGYDIRGSADKTACPECGAAVSRMPGWNPA